MVIGDIVIIIRFHQTIKTHASMTRGKTRDCLPEFDPIISLTSLLLVTSFLHLILTIPYGIYLLLDKGSLSYGTLKLVHVFALSTEYLNNSINFILYCIASKPFRKVFLATICLRKCCFFPSTVQPITKNIMSDHQNSVQKQLCQKISPQTTSILC